MDTIFYMKKVFSLIFGLVYYKLMLHGTIFFFCSCRVNGLAYFLGEMLLVTAIMGEISSGFGAMYNDLLHTSGHSPADKIEERINFAFIHARLYLAE